MESELETNEYENILIEMNLDDLETELNDVQPKKNFKKNKPRSEEAKLDLLITEIGTLKEMVSDLHEVSLLQHQEIETLKNLVKENRQVTYNTYRKLEKMEKENIGVIGTIADYALPILGSLGFNSVPITIAANLNRISKLGNNAYKLYNNGK